MKSVEFLIYYVWILIIYQCYIYIYILVKNGDTVVGEKREALLTNIGKAIGEQLEEKIETELKLLIDQMEVK